MMPPREPHDHDLDANHVHRGPPGHVGRFVTLSLF